MGPIAKGGGTPHVGFANLSNAIADRPCSASRDHGHHDPAEPGLDRIFVASLPEPLAKRNPAFFVTRLKPQQWRHQV